MRRTSLAIVLGVALAGVGTIATAARNSSGSYTLPNSPFVSGTSISSSAVNQNFSDLGNEVGSSLDRTGRGGMLAPLRTVDGTLAAPAHSFTNEAGTGWWRNGSSDLRLSIAGTLRQKWNATDGITSYSPAADGTNVVGLVHDTTNSLTGTGALLVSLRNAGAEKASIDKAGGATFSAGLSTDSTITPTLGDIFATRGTTSGYVFLGRNSGGRYVGYDGTNYLMPGAPLVNAATFVVAGRIAGPSGVSCGTLYQSGSVTATCVRNGTGDYTVSVTGLTTSGVATATAINAGSAVTAYLDSIASGSFRVRTVTVAGSAADVDMTFAVLKL